MDLLVQVLKTCAWCQRVEMVRVEPEYAELVATQSICRQCYEKDEDARDWS